MRKLKKIFIITVMVLFFFINVSLGATGTVNSDVVRVREKPNTSSEIVINVYKEDKVEITEKDGEWLKVKVGEKVGYIKAEFINIKDENNIKKAEPTNNTTESSENNNFAAKTKLNVRITPSMISKFVGTIEKGKELTKLDTINNWIKITDGNITGWVSNNRLNSNTEIEENNNEAEKKETKEEIKTEDNKAEKKETDKENDYNNKVAIVNVDSARVRKSSNINAEIIGLLDENTEIKIISEENGWYKINYEEKEGYISETVVTLKDKQNVSSRSLQEGRQDRVEEMAESIPEPENTAPEVVENNVPITSGAGQSVVDFAKQFLGFPYVYAGKTPETGFDCSGFTKYVFSNFGFELGGSAGSQMGVGREVSRSELVAGDLLLFYDEGKTQVGHAGIYIDGGVFIHAANPRRGVVTDNINTNSYYNERFVMARRLVE